MAIEVHLAAWVPRLIVLLQVARLREAVEADVALVRLAAVMEPEVIEDVAALLECPVAALHQADIIGLGFFISRVVNTINFVPLWRNPLERLQPFVRVCRTLLFTLRTSVELR